MEKEERNLKRADGSVKAYRCSLWPNASLFDTINVIILRGLAALVDTIRA